MGLGGTGWTADVVRLWLRDAMETLHYCKGDGPGRTRSSLPTPVHDTMLAYGWQKARAPRQNTPAELAKLDVVLEWVRLFEPDTRKALVGVAMGLPLRKIARAIGCSHTQVANLERKAVAFLVDALNGG
ncbi:DUF6362 family protein [Azospirillum argentinense]|uniref:DUF6362 domain-containing protein n=1 Tax=Azospirillum brasilense TaxID=192 RepID=A0A4D8QL46_AZOBR|nr:DUF6362 family protein [Azospirillum argentinense]QCO07569.1 hypothetical protein D3867_37430 [Azospirillum argentinense]